MKVNDCPFRNDIQLFLRWMDRQISNLRDRLMKLLSKVYTWHLQFQNKLITFFSETFFYLQNPKLIFLWRDLGPTNGLMFICRMSALFFGVFYFKMCLISLFVKLDLSKSKFFQNSTFKRLFLIKIERTLPHLSNWYIIFIVKHFNIEEVS